MPEKESIFALRGRVIWLYLKFQLLTKGLFFMVILPLFSHLLRYLIRATGRVNISSGDYAEFLFSIHGLGMLVLGLSVLVLMTGMDINAFIIMSALIREGRMRMNSTAMLFAGLKSLRSFLRPSGLFVMLYAAFALPLVGIGFGISPTENFKIPNFITDVIFNNAAYTAAYAGLILLLGFISLRYIFTFHYILLWGENVGQALKRASRLMRRHWKAFLKDFIWHCAKLLILAFFIMQGFMLFCNVGVHFLAKTAQEQRLWTLFGALVVAELTGVLSFMTVPYVSYRLTDLFYRYNTEDGKVCKFCLHMNTDSVGKEAFTKVRLGTKLLLALIFLLFVSFNLVLALFLNTYFHESFRMHKDMVVVAHRGGGNLAAENSLAGLEAAIREGAAWSEIDVQRTKDGAYVIHHDKSLKRLMGESKSASDLSLAEIKNLKIKDLFDEDRAPQTPSTLEEFMDAAKGRIGLYIELKGSTADEKMVDDVVALIKEKGMEKETAVLALDYHLIRYVEEKYPEIESGFLYFFSIGESSKMQGDILIMEEGEASAEKVSEIQAAGKKAVVWTVNTEESIERFVNSEVDGIITDDVPAVKEELQRRAEKTDVELILDALLGE